MKRIASIFIGICVVIPVLKSQEIKLSLYDGWTFARAVDNYHYSANFYEGTINSAWRQGIGLSCFLENSYDLGLVYYRQNTTVPAVFHISGSTFDHQFDMRIQWILADFLAYFTKTAFKPFLGSDMGVGIITLKDAVNSAQTSRVKFTWGGNVGFEYAFRKLISLRVKADGLYTVKLNSPSKGALQSDISSYNSYLQTAINGGIVFRFKMKKKR
jgi:hypothetical protein